jgi:hypothetical protein
VALQFSAPQVKVFWVKLGVIYEPGSANAYYRAILPLQALEQRGHTVIWPTKPDSVPMREFLRCDLVHCYRRMDRIGDLRVLSERGVAISFDNDDNYAAAEVSDGGRGLEGHQRNQRLHREVIEVAQLADLTTTPSELLAEQYRLAGARHITVIENHLRREMLGFGGRSKHEGITVGWIAGREHRLDLDRIPIVEALRRLLEVHPELRVLTVGVRLTLPSEHYEHIPEVPFRDLLKITSRIDIGIAPLADTVFNRSRSSVKLKEYSSGGTTWLASPVGPYRALGEKQGGALVADNEWFTALDALVADRRRRRRLAKRALRWAKAQTIDHHVGMWETAFLEASERSRRNRPTAVATRAR